jgi:hypothetical protein
MAKEEEALKDKWIKVHSKIIADMEKEKNRRRLEDEEEEFLKLYTS